MAKLQIDEIRALPELSLGSKHNGLSLLHQYLREFGYIAELPARASVVFSDTTTAALRRFQRQFGLQPTGTFDQETRAAMAQSRCGFPDVDPVGAKIGRAHV